MVEETKTEGTQQVTDDKTEVKEESSVPKLSELVDRAEKANKEMSELLKRQEELVAKNLLGGQTDAGDQKVEKKEETPEEYAKRIMGGS